MEDSLQKSRRFLYVTLTEVQENIFKNSLF